MPKMIQWTIDYNLDKTISQRIHTYDSCRFATYGVCECVCARMLAIGPKERMGKQTRVGIVMKTKTNHIVWIRSFIVP